MPALPLTLGRVTTCDIYRSGNAPPSAPDVSGATIHLQGKFANTKVAPTYTHRAYLPLATDLRDTDTLYVPNKNGTAFTVTKLGRTRTPNGQDVRTAYLTRSTNPGWPTQNL